MSIVLPASFYILQKYVLSEYTNQNSFSEQYFLLSSTNWSYWNFVIFCGKDGGENFPMRFQSSPMQFYEMF